MGAEKVAVLRRVLRLLSELLAAIPLEVVRDDELSGLTTRYPICSTGVCPPMMWRVPCEVAMHDSGRVDWRRSDPPWIQLREGRGIMRYVDPPASVSPLPTSLVLRFDERPADQGRGARLVDSPGAQVLSGVASYPDSETSAVANCHFRVARSGQEGGYTALLGIRDFLRGRRVVSFRISSAALSPWMPWTANRGPERERTNVQLHESEPADDVVMVVGRRFHVGSNGTNGGGAGGHYEYSLSVFVMDSEDEFSRTCVTLSSSSSPPPSDEPPPHSSEPGDRMGLPVAAHLLSEGARYAFAAMARSASVIRLTFALPDDPAVLWGSDPIIADALFEGHVGAVTGSNRFSREDGAVVRTILYSDQPEPMDVSMGRGRRPEECIPLHVGRLVDSLSERHWF